MAGSPKRETRELRLRAPETAYRATRILYDCAEAALVTFVTATALRPALRLSVGSQARPCKSRSQGAS